MPSPPKPCIDCGKLKSPVGVRCRACAAVLIGLARRNPPLECRRCGKQFPYQCSEGKPWKYCSNECRKEPRFIKRTGKYSYAYVLQPHHPRATYDGYVREHRLVAEHTLGRFLLPTEIVHHIDGDTLNNRPENLAVLASIGEHTKKHKPRRRVTVQCNICGKTVERKFCDSVRRNPRHFYCSLACRSKRFRIDSSN
jgi:hypothetical protein